MALHSRRALLRGVATASAVTLAGCTGPAFSIPVTVTNSTDGPLSVTVSLAEKKFFDGQGQTWTLDLDVGDTVELSLGGGGRPADEFRLVVDPDGREQVRSTLRNPLRVAVDIDDDRVRVAVSKYSGEETTETNVVADSLK